MVPSISRGNNPLLQIPTAPGGKKNLPLPSAQGLKIGPSGEGLHVNGNTKIANVVKTQFPKGKV